MWTNLIELIETTSRVSIEALLNGLWQGVALTVVIWALVKVAPKLHPRGRFAIWSATLAVIVGLPFVTGQRLLPAVIAQYFIAGVEQEAVAVEQAPGDKFEGLSTRVHEAASEQKDSPLATVTTMTNPQFKDGVFSLTNNSLGNSREGIAGNAEYPDLLASEVSQSSELVNTNESSNTLPVEMGAPNVVSSSEKTLLSIVLSRTGALAFFGLWLIVSVALLLRLVYSYWRLQELQASASDAPQRLQEQFTYWIEKQKITRKVRLLVSEEISVPLAVGFGAPAVIVPQGILESLSDGEFDLVFVHELAHLKRHDDWSVFWQQVAQALFFVNPATIWIARRMDFEREVACDAEVVSHLGCPRKYAACLARLAELSTTPRHSAMVAGTFVRKNRLVSRIERLLDSATIGNSRISRVTVGATFAVLVLALAQFTIIPAVVAVEEPHSQDIVASEGAVVTPFAYPSDHLTNSVEVAALSFEETVKKYEKQRRGAEERLSSLSSALEKLENESSRITPTRQAKVDAYRRSLSKYERKLARLSEALDRLSTSKVAIGSSVHRFPGLLSTPSAPSVPAAPGAAPLSLRRTRSGYSYSYTVPQVRVPSVSVAPIPPVVAVAPQYIGSSEVTVSSGVGNEIRISIPNFSIDSDGSWSISDDDGQLNYNWSDGRRQIRVRAQGEIQFNDDESDILSISDNGYFSVQERDRGLDKEYEVLADEDGELEKTYFADGRRSDIDDGAKLWIQETILFVLRNSSIGAKERAERILARDGIDGLLGEIELIESDYNKRVYYVASFSSGKMNAEQTRKALSQLTNDISSDYEKAQILAAIDAAALNDEETLASYVAVVSSIGSDYEKRRSLEAVLTREVIPKDVVLGLLAAAKGFDSDYERAELLRGLAEGGLAGAEVVDAYAEAIVGIDSDYEKRRALEAISNRKDLSEETVIAILKMAQSIDSDYERAELLSDMSGYTQDDDAYAEAYYQAIVDIDSNYEKRRVLSKFLKRRKLSEAMALNILKLSETIDSDYDRTELLMDMARFNAGYAEFYQAYVAALKDIDSDYDTKRALDELNLDERAPKQVLLDVLSIIDGFSSDYEKAGVLKKIATLYSSDDTLYGAFIEVVDEIDSDYERDRVYAALYKASRSSDSKSRRGGGRTIRDSGRD